MRQFVTKPCLVGVFGLVLLSGCGNGGSSGGANVAPVQPAMVVGTAAKGLIKNGVVTLYSVDSNGVKSASLASGRTSSEDGSYSLEIAGYTGPVLVEITATGDANDPSIMICDIPGADSCDTGVGFGDDYTLGSDFSLKAIEPDVTSGSQVTTNVTALTHLAAAYAEKNGITKDSVYVANSQVSNLFGIAGDITKLPVVDVTDKAALEKFTGSTNQETAAALKAATLSAALLAAAKADGANINTAVEAVAQSFVINNGQMVQNESGDTTTTLSEILASAVSLISSELSDVPALAEVNTEITADKVAADNASDGALTTAEPDEDNLSDSFQKAKALVQDLRDIATASTFDEIRTGAGQFADNLELATDLINADTGYLVEALSLVAEAIGEAALEQAQGPTYTAENGVVVTVGMVDGVASYSVDDAVVVNDEQGAHSANVQLTGLGEIEIDEQDPVVVEGSESGSAAVTANFAISGLLANSAARLEIKNGSLVSITGFHDSWSDTWNDLGETSTGELVVDNASFSLKVALGQLEGQTPVLFDGGLALHVKGFTNAWDDSAQYQRCDYVESVYTCSESDSASDVTNFSTLDLILSGTFTQATESFAANLVFNATNNGFELQSTELWQYASNGSYPVWQNSSATSEETESAYVSANAVLDLTTQLEGISDDVAVRIAADRSAYEAGTLSVTLKYNGKTIDAEAELAGPVGGHSGKLTITNNQGAVLTWEDTNLDDEVEVLEGTITVDGVQQAVLQEENDVIVIRYNNGYFESF